MNDVKVNNVSYSLKEVKKMRKLMVIFLSGVICVLGAIPVLAQSQYSTLLEYEKATGKKIVKFNEAPMLRVKVAAGELPPVEERLPEEPVVVKPVEEIGQYGGVLHVLGFRPGRLEDGRNTIGKAYILQAARDASTILPNLAKKWDFAKDGKTLTLYFRKGVKWSDGVPFTADDIMFWYEDVLQNKDLTPVLPKKWIVGGELVKIKKIDDYTVCLQFAKPYPMILSILATTGENDFYYPKHYLKQFHPKYTPMERLKKVVKAKGFNNWWELFKHMSPRYSEAFSMDNASMPTLRSHMVSKVGPNYIVQTRNPYYWKIDPEGNQLPYIDKIYTLTVDKEVYSAKIASGETDFAARYTTLDNLALYKGGEEKGNYEVRLWRSPYGAETIYYLNATVQDPVLRKIFNDVRFRRALSLAINREEINKVVYFGLAIPRQATQPYWSKFYEPEFAKAYAQYDPKRANALLDEMGLKWDERHEYRLRPDGKKLVIQCEYTDPFWTAVNEMVASYWKKIGIDMPIKMVDRSLHELHMRTNNFHIQPEIGASMDPGFLDDPKFCVPTQYGGCQTWAPLWAQWWMTNGEKGEEPPEEVRKNIERWQKIQVTMDEKERIRLAKEILRSQAENLWTIGVTGCGPWVVIVRKNLKNVLKEGIWSYEFLDYGNYANPEQWFFLKK